MTSLKKQSAIALAWDAGGTLVRQGSGFIISIFLARLLEPEEFGMVGMSMAFISISQVFIDVGFSAALVQSKDNSKLTYSSVFYLNLFAGFLLTALFFFAAPLIGEFYANDKFIELVRWLSLIFIFSSLNRVQSAILIRNLNFKVLTLRMLSASILGGSIGIYYAFEGLGVYSLIIQQISTALISTVLLWAVSGWKPDFKFSLKEVKKLSKFSLFVFFDSFISTIFQKLDVMLIGKIFSPASLGFYSRAVSLKDQVTNYSSSSLSKVFFPVLSGLQEDRKRYSEVYFKVISVIAFMSYGLTGALFVLGENIILQLFGEKWEPSVEIFQILILAACNKPLNLMMINALNSIGKSKENFIIGLFRKAMIIVPLFIAYYFGIMSFAIGFVCVSYMVTIAHIFLLRRIVGLDSRMHFRKIFEGMIPLSVLLGCTYYYTFTSLYQNIAVASIYIIGYVLFNYKIKSEGLLFLIDEIRRRKWLKVK